MQGYVQYWAMCGISAEVPNASKETHLTELALQITCIAEPELNTNNQNLRGRNDGLLFLFFSSSSCQNSTKLRYNLFGLKTNK